MSLVLKCSIHIVSILTGMLKMMLYLTGRYHDLKKRCARKKESAQPMKKSCLIAVIAVLAAVAGALVAVAVYLRRREKELDEYERLLFGEDEAVPAVDEAEDDAAAAAEVVDSADEDAAAE